MIDPFTLNPVGPFDRLLSYWFATWLRVQYYADEWPEGEGVISDLVGGIDYQIFSEVAPKTPRIDVILLPGGKSIAAIRGTTMTSQLALEIMGAGLVTFPPFPGRVGLFFANEATLSWLRIGHLLGGQWISCGHSLGGALAGMISFRPENPAFRIWSMGAPREGNLEYSLARPSPAYLRITNARDLVPLIPSSTSTFADSLAIDTGFLWTGVFYRHWGVRVNLWPDTSANRPEEIATPLEITTFLVDQISSLELIPTGHNTSEYGRRIRGGIPVRFPATGPDVDFPGLFELDNLQLDMNGDDGIEWTVDGRHIISPPNAGFLPPVAPWGPLVEPERTYYRCQ